MYRATTKMTAIVRSCVWFKGTLTGVFKGAYLIKQSVSILIYCKTLNFRVEEIFASFAVDKKNLQIYHPANLFSSTWPTLPFGKNPQKCSCKKFKIEKLQNFTATNISCLTVLSPIIFYSVNVIHDCIPYNKTSSIEAF